MEVVDQGVGLEEAEVVYVFRDGRLIREKVPGPASLPKPEQATESDADDEASGHLQGIGVSDEGPWSETPEYHLRVEQVQIIKGKCTDCSKSITTHLDHEWWCAWWDTEEGKRKTPF
jgi:hypothetical protein